TKPVLAEKADSIAEVFTTAGVTVMIMEAPEPVVPEPAAPGDDEAGSADEVAATDYEAVYQEEFPDGPDLPVSVWSVDSAWESDDDDVPWDAGQSVAAAAVVGRGAVLDAEPDQEPVAAADDVPARPAPGEAPAETAEPKLPSTRW